MNIHVTCQCPCNCTYHNILDEGPNAQWGHPWGPGEVSCIERCPHFRGKFRDTVKCPLYRGVLRYPSKGVPLYIVHVRIFICVWDITELVYIHVSSPQWPVSSLGNKFFFCFFFSDYFLYPESLGTRLVAITTLEAWLKTLVHAALHVHCMCFTVGVLCALH